MNWSGNFHVIHKSFENYMGRQIYIYEAIWIWMLIDYKALDKTSTKSSINGK